MKVQVVVHAHSKKPRIEKEGIVLHVYVKEAAIENKANKAVIEALAKYFSVPKTTITLSQGLKSKVKVFEI